MWLEYCVSTAVGPDIQDAEFLCRYMQKWCKAWEEDLEKRPAAVKSSGPGDGACAAAVHVYLPQSPRQCTDPGQVS